MVNDPVTPVYQIDQYKALLAPADLLSMTGQDQPIEERVRSKGQATLLPEGHPEFQTTIRDISISGLGVIAPNSLHPGTFVRIDIHGHAAQGIVQSCQPECDNFYIGIALDRPATSEAPAA